MSALQWGLAVGVTGACCAAGVAWRRARARRRHATGSNYEALRDLERDQDLDEQDDSLDSEDEDFAVAEVEAAEAAAAEEQRRAQLQRQRTPLPDGLNRNLIEPHLLDDFEPPGTGASGASFTTAVEETPHPGSSSATWMQEMNAELAEFDALTTGAGDGAAEWTPSMDEGLVETPAPGRRL